MARFYEQLAAALAENQPFTLALISGVKGSSPQRIGAKALFFPGRTNRRHAGRRLSGSGSPCPRQTRFENRRGSATFEMLLDHDFGWDDGLICGGSVSRIDSAARGGSGGTLAQTRHRHRTGSLGRQKGFFHRAGCRERGQSSAAPQIANE